MKFIFLTTALLLVSVHHGHQTTCPNGNYLMEFTKFRIIDQSTGTDLDEIQVYKGATLDISGTITTSTPISSGKYTASVQMRLVGSINFLGMVLDVSEPIDCPVSMASNSGSSECSLTALCEELAGLLGSAESFSCPTISGVVNFQVYGLRVDPLPAGTIPSAITNDYNPRLEMKLEITTDEGTLISCLDQEINLDVDTQ